MAVKNTFYDSVGGIASGEGLVHIEMTQRKDFNQEKKKHPHPKEFQIIPRISARKFSLLRLLLKEISARK